MNLKFIDNVIFPKWIENYDSEEISNIKHAAQTHGKYLKKFSDQRYLLKRSVELSKSSKYKGLDLIQKLIFISNVVFENDESFIHKMEVFGWSKEKSDALNTLISKIKLLQRKKYEITLDLSLIEEIEHISLVCFGVNNPAILINRLNELSVTKKEEIHHTKKY